MRDMLRPLLSNLNLQAQKAKYCIDDVKCLLLFLSCDYGLQHNQIGSVSSVCRKLHTIPSAFARLPQILLQSIRISSLISKSKCFDVSSLCFVSLRLSGLEYEQVWGFLFAKSSLSWKSLTDCSNTTFDFSHCFALYGLWGLYRATCRRMAFSLLRILENGKKGYTIYGEC